MSTIPQIRKDINNLQAFIDAYEPPDHTRKRIGSEFEGVMCSATSADQACLMAILMAIQLQGPHFQPTRFEFENGNSLVITIKNYQAFMAVWVPFRQSFFKVSE
jgi:hypothetical protein